jgi:hypothetical protein
MALSSTSFLRPLGDVDPGTMFPESTDQEVRTFLESWIVEGTAKATSVSTDLRDAAVSAWVYYRVYNVLYVALNATPTSNAMADQGSTLFTGLQITNIKELRDNALAEFQAYVSAEVAAAPAPPRITTTVHNRYRF